MNAASGPQGNFAQPKPFTWTADPDKIIAAAKDRRLFVRNPDARTLLKNAVDQLKELPRIAFGRTPNHDPFALESSFTLSSTDVRRFHYRGIEAYV